MVRRVARGEIWLYRFAAPDKRRPVLVLSRPEAITYLRTVMVAPITSTRHGVASEVDLDERHGLKGPSAVSLDHVTAVPKDQLKKYVATLGPVEMAAVCGALAIATGCV